MSFFHFRAFRWAVLLTVVALNACADQPAPTQPVHTVEPQLAAGDVFVVTTTSGGTETGSLRWLVSQATGGEVIRFDPRIAGATITLDTTLIVPKFITIEGPADKGITISGGNKVRVMHVHEGATLRNLTITGGNDIAFGGGIYAYGPLTLEHSTVSGNTSGNAGGMYVEEVTLINSTVANNTASSLASGISFDFQGKLTLINSTVAHNTPAPGIRPHGATSYTPTVTLRNSIIANNGVPTNNCWYPTGFVYEGTNIAGDNTCGDATVIMLTDPKLGALADNGGPSMTIPFAYDSPARDAATNCTVTVDQRYVSRDARCDIGAFEFTDFTIVTLNIDASVSVNQGAGWAVVTGTVQCSRDETFDVKVDLTQNQKVGRATTVVQATGSSGVACGTTARPWSVAVAPLSGAFQVGSGQVTAQTVNTSGWTTPASASKAVKLYWGHR